jgi:hypothetical protein
MGFKEKKAINRNHGYGANYYYYANKLANNLMIGLKKQYYLIRSNLISWKAALMTSVFPSSSNLVVIQIQCFVFLSPLDLNKKAFH